MGFFPPFSLQFPPTRLINEVVCFSANITWAEFEFDTSDSEQREQWETHLPVHLSLPRWARLVQQGRTEGFSHTLPQSSAGMLPEPSPSTAPAWTPTHRDILNMSLAKYSIWTIFCLDHLWDGEILVVCGEDRCPLVVACRRYRCYHLLSLERRSRLRSAGGVFKVYTQPFSTQK